MIEDEIKAIRRITAALEGLPQRTRNRVMRYVFDAEADVQLAKEAEQHLVSVFDAVPPMQCREPELDVD